LSPIDIVHTEKIACYVTVRDEKAMQLLESGLKVKENVLLWIWYPRAH
jgi:large subunit ribosomal protein L11e